jgi:hypothetical protein
VGKLSHLRTMAVTWHMCAMHATLA